MAKRMEGKVVFLTGGSEGIGRTTAIRLAEEGAFVAINARRAAPLEETARLVREAGGKCSTHMFDVVEHEKLQAAINEVAKTHGRLDGLVNNAFSSSRAPIIDLHYEVWRRDFAVNADAVFLATQAAMRIMIPQKSGSIVNIASACGLKALYNMSAYSASKAALIHFTNCAAIEGGPHNVRANVVSPGQITTESLGLIHKDAARRAAQVAENIPLRRSGTTTELANAILYMLSDESSFVTGTVLPVDGGYNNMLYAPPSPDGSNAAKPRDIPSLANS
jgi:meso-butanediol dehydrogenase / (S,S)-butanediol dehydrogenase / diacetyl reductase